MTQQPQPEPADTAPPKPGRSGVSGTIGSLLLGLAVAGSILLLLFGVKRAQEFQVYDFLLTGMLAVAVSLSAAGIGVWLRTLRRTIDNAAARLGDHVASQNDNLASAASSLVKLDDHSLVSERAKLVAYRKQDREAVRRAIEEDLLAGDYASARQLADEFENAFGYKHEADRFREEIRRRIEDARGHEIGEATGRVDELCDQERWADAFAESDRLISKYDNDMRVRLIRTRIEERRQGRKVELVKQFHAARERGDADAGSDLLKQLDAYLTPDEGRQLEAQAREVFKEKLMQLKDRFSAALHEKDFSEALRLGTIIRRDYPNSKLAREVAEHEPRIRERAGMAPEDEPAPI
ncbi:MAG: hypothetical protein AAGI46_15745 [Planctomycetota bacterium]